MGVDRLVAIRTSLQYDEQDEHAHDRPSFDRAIPQKVTIDACLEQEQVDKECRRVSLDVRVGELRAAWLCLDRARLPLATSRERGTHTLREHYVLFSVLDHQGRYVGCTVHASS